MSENILEGPGLYFLGLGAGDGPRGTPISNYKDLFGTKSTQVAGQKFPVTGWDPILKAMAIATVFASNGSDWKREDWCPPPPDPTKDVETLLQYRDKGRKERREEIEVQAQTFYDYFAQLLSAVPPSRPHTHVLVMTGYYVGAIVVAYWKLKHMRARPVQVCPEVYPIIMTPPHPSYPSGHALESELASKCAMLVAPATMHNALQALAARIGENREYAGVHYPSDTARSRAMAPLIFSVLNNRKLVPEFGELVDLAKTEW